MTRPDVPETTADAAGPLAGPAGAMACSPDGDVLAALVASAPLFVWQADALGRVSWASQRCLEYLGLRAEQTHGAGWLAAVEPAHRERVAAAWRVAVAAGTRYETEFAVRRAADGEYHWHLVRADPVRAPDGRIERWVGIALDVHAARGALAARERDIVMLADNSPAIIARFDRAHRHLFVNRAVEAATGRAASEFLGRTSRELGMPESLCARWDAALAAVFDTGCPQQVEFAFASPAGERIFRSVIGPERDTSGRIETVVAVAQDVTKERAALERLADSERRFRVLADTMPQIVWTTRPDGWHDWFNGRWYEYTGMPRPHAPGGKCDAAASALGWRWQDWVHPADVEHALAAWRESLASGRPYQAEYRLRRYDGEYRWFMGRALALRDGAGGAIARWFGTLTDIDDARLAAAEREALIARLHEADARKDEFLAMLAHELRNPLAPVLNAVKVIERSEPLAEHGAAALVMIERQVRHMRRLVDDLLEVSRITRGKIELQVEPMLLTTAVGNVVEALLPAIEAKQQTLEVVQPARPLRIHADPVRVTQILENLVTNASKYTPAGGAIRIEVTEHGSEACVRVLDNGIGIAPGLLPRVFELFVQAHVGTEHAAGGLGIGLAMVKRLVSMHGGCAWAESAGPGRGSTFVVRLPMAGPAAAPRAPANPATGPAGG